MREKEKEKIKGKKEEVEGSYYYKQKGNGRTAKDIVVKEEINKKSEKGKGIKIKG